jgi:hypothetical protein
MHLLIVICWISFNVGLLIASSIVIFLAVSDSYSHLNTDMDSINGMYR